MSSRRESSGRFDDKVAIVTGAAQGIVERLPIKRMVDGGQVIR